jgi:hypothetical protein
LGAGDAGQLALAVGEGYAYCADAFLDQEAKALGEGDEGVLTAAFY